MGNREITRTGYSSLGALAGVGGVAAVGLASIAVQLGGVLWILAFIGLAALAAVLFWASVMLLRRGRLHQPPPQPTGGGPRR